MNDNILITASNSQYFYSLKTLVASIHRLSIKDIDCIYVFNLGLTNDEINEIKTWQKTKIINFPDYINTNPKEYVYKCYANFWSQESAKKSLWLDAGVMLLKPIDVIFDIIDKEDIFLVGDVHLNKNFTHDRCIEIIGATESELNDTQLSAGILGHKINGKYQKMINDAYEYSKIEGCVPGNEQNHRHDQSVYSILASRYNCKKYNIDIYGYWTDSNRNLQTAIENNAVLFVHRNGHWDFTGLLTDNP